MGTEISHVLLSCKGIHQLQEIRQIYAYFIVPGIDYGLEKTQFVNNSKSGVTTHITRFNMFSSASFSHIVLTSYVKFSEK